jgi:hypothetical protein
MARLQNTLVSRPTEPEDDADRWVIADRIQAQIVDLLNAELRQTQNPGQLLVGQLLALVSMCEAVPQAELPGTLKALDVAARACLVELIQLHREPAE